MVLTHRRAFVGAGLTLAATLVCWSASAQYGAAPRAVVGPQGASGPEYYSSQLGIYYQLVPYGSNGGLNPSTGNYDPNNPPGSGGYPVQASSYGARLTRYPVARSASAYLQLEPGDMIVSLDNLPIYGPDDVNNHRFQTSMVFVNVRTSQPQAANIILP